MRTRRILINNPVVAQMGTECDTIFNILDFCENPAKVQAGKVPVDEAYNKLQREVYARIVLPSYDDAELPENPPSEYWARTAGAQGVLIYFPAGKYLWEGVPQLWPKTGIFGDGYFATVFNYSSNQVNKTKEQHEQDGTKPEQLAHWEHAAYGDPSLLVLGTCTIMGKKLLGVNHGVRDIRFIPGWKGRENSGVIMAGHLMNQYIGNLNLMQHGKGAAHVGIGTLAVQGDWTPKSLFDIYNDVVVHGQASQPSNHVNDLVIENCQIEKANVGLWLTSVVYGQSVGNRIYHAKVGEMTRACHHFRTSSMVTNCDLGGYYNKSGYVSLIIADKVRRGYAYKYQSRDSAEERRNLRFVTTGTPAEKLTNAIGSQFDEKIGIWNPGDPVPGD